MPAIHYEHDKVTGFYRPTAYPVQVKYDMKLPESISQHFNQMTALIEDKYTKEFLKVCAFYNKLFTSLKQYDWSRSSYNTLAFTVQHQERMDTGTGLSANYLKTAVDLVVSRVGNTGFEYKLKSDNPSVKFTIFKDSMERTLKSIVRKNKLVHKLGVESFHDAAILGFAHAFVDPWAGKIRKVSDWELGCYETEFNEGRLCRAMIRDFAFPVAYLGPYIDGFDPRTIEDILKSCQHVDLRLYIDCLQHKKYVAIRGDVGPASEYPFDEVLLSTFSWDMGIRKTTIASLFDQLYPLQRQMDKLLAKKTQLLTMYKGPVPVFSGSDVDVIVKQLSNSSGEVLFLDTQRKASDLLTVLEPTPLDPNLNAEFEGIKAQMFEIAGVQQISMDVENYRSAAAVIALDQMRDAGFQSQLSSLAQYIKDIIDMFVKYMAQASNDDVSGVSWKEILEMMDDSYVDIVPVHDNDAKGGIDSSQDDFDPMQRHVNLFLLQICRNEATFDDVDFSYDYLMLKQQAALRYVEFRALGGDETPESYRLLQFLSACFVKDIAVGEVALYLDPLEEGGPLPGGDLIPGEGIPATMEEALGMEGGEVGEQ